MPATAAEAAERYERLVAIVVELKNVASGDATDLAQQIWDENAVRHRMGANVMSAPVKASSIKVTAADLGKTDEQIRQERVTAAVKGRRARAEALRQVGALTGAGSPDLATSLEARLKARLDAGAKSFKAKQAVDAMRKRQEAAR